MFVYIHIFNTYLYKVFIHINTHIQNITKCNNKTGFSGENWHGEIPKHCKSLPDLRAAYMHPLQGRRACRTWVTFMSHIDDLCHMWMRRVKCGWVMSCMNTSCDMWMSHVICECVVSHVDESMCMWMSRVTCGWVVSYMNESCYMWMSQCVCEWVVSHVY